MRERKRERERERERECDRSKPFKEFGEEWPFMVDVDAFEDRGSEYDSQTTKEPSKHGGVYPFKCRSNDEISDDLQENNLHEMTYKQK